jgi:hypothetical protein
MKIIIKESQYNLLIEKFDFDKNNFISVEHLISDEGKFKDILSDNSVSSEYKSAIKALLQSYRDLVFQSPEETKKINVYDLITMAHQLNNKLNAFEKLLHHPIHINRFLDKYGNKYIQARTSLTDKSSNKLKNFSAYVGSYNDYPEGINSEAAKIRGKELIRKKLEPYFNIGI